MEEKRIEATSISFVDKMKNYFSKSNWVNLVALFGFLLFTVSFAFIIADIVDDITTPGKS